MVDRFRYFNHLGFHNPYYLDGENGRIITSSFEDIISVIPANERVLDFTAVTEVFSLGYCLGDRTLVRGLSKSPWMAKPNLEDSSWDYYSLPKHSFEVDEIGSVAMHFSTLLQEELINYVHPHTNIGVLLTGGMDSRIVVAILKSLLDQGKLVDKNIYTYTWGREGSRDVVYASKIAEMYGWSWTHLPVDVDQMKENFAVAVSNGCEYTAIHLHAMSQIARRSHLDCVLAGSFGDSVGRAEFSGVKVQQLVSLEKKIKNLGGLLRGDLCRLVSDQIQYDMNRYRDLFPVTEQFQSYEHEQQLHYMRRMLNACMSVIDQKIPLYQMFSSPAVFGYMWSLSPKIRGNDIYKVLLEQLAPELLSIPWARTGLKYPNTKGESDTYDKKHHDYGKMIRDNFLEMICESVEENISIASMLFDVSSINKAVRNLKKFPIEGKLVYEEKLIYVAQVLNFISKFDVKVDLPQYDGRLLLSTKEDLKYKVRYYYNKLR